ncbi:peptidoglycan D,D-transpeptidase FtsI family protein [Bacillus massiliigorillae]|uniref:peptidoglycan D,D-transpeptidase FtsI family protein n=1 Tax=Bacillus massiliigorillae TaxID=1243664 RepID=UPI00039C3E54|nr:penicillin-binding transpeptidase domain-containing protein [Bacillus massiliigorillae]
MLKEKRAIGIASMFLFLLCMLIARLVQIQLVSTESFSKHHVNLIEESVNQRVQSIMLDDGRGKFYDRANNLLNYEQVNTLILFPFLKKMTWPVEELAGIINVSPTELKEAVQKAKEPFLFTIGDKPIILTESQMDDINDLKTPGVFATVRDMPTETKVAEHLIGGLNGSSELKEKRYGDRNLSLKTKIGDKGLQQTLDEFLLSEGESRLVYHVDGMGGPLFGINVKYLAPGNPLYPVKVNTTIDLELQRAAEEIVDSNKIEKGGIILLDIASSEILASVSRPHVGKDPNEGDGAKNAMFKQAAVGSVFKTVVAASALEEKVVDENELFNCNMTINGSVDKRRSEPLGMLNFSNSFAQSCNRTFADLAIRLSKKDPNLLEQYAKRLQLIGESGWNGPIYHSSIKQLFLEDDGRVWLDETNKKDLNFISQTAIGQKDVQATPLAVANMMATIARNGEKKMVKAVSKIEFANGTTAAEFEDMDIKGDKIAPATAKRLQQLLRGVIQNEKGTAALQLRNLPIQVAGKTGTAQTDIANGKVNSWFGGYFPADNPKYAIVAVKLDTDENLANGSATKVVKDYIQKMMEIEKIK